MSLESFFPEQKKSVGFKRPTASADKGEITGVNLVDYSQIVLSTIMATYKPTDTIDIDMLRHLVLNTLRANVMKNKRHYPHIILCIDNGTGGYWRKKLAWYYKYKRSENRDKSGWDFGVIFEAMRIVKEEIVENMPYVVMDIAGMEADDHIGILSNYFGKKGIPILITSSDGDFTQLHKIPKLKQYSPIQKAWVKPKHGSPHLDLMYKIIKGDKKDGIASYKAKSDHYAQTDAPRAPSIRKKELDLLLKSSFDEMKELLSESEYARIIENRTLLDLDYIPEDLQKNVIKTYEEYKVQPRNKIYPYFVSKGLVKLMTDVSEF